MEWTIRRRLKKIGAGKWLLLWWVDRICCTITSSLQINELSYLEMPLYTISFVSSIVYFAIIEALFNFKYYYHHLPVILPSNFPEFLRIVFDIFDES